MLDFIFSINKKNAHVLKGEYELNLDDTEEILLRFRPIIEVFDRSPEEINQEMERLVSIFIAENQRLDIDIFHREHLEMAIYMLESYVDALQKGKGQIWNEYKGVNFIWMRMPLDQDRSETLLLTPMSPTQLEIYFKNTHRIIVELIEDLNNRNKEPDKVYDTSNELDKDSSAETNNDSLNYREIIEKLFDHEDPNEGWRRIFRNENDYNQYVDILINHFKNEYSAAPNIKLNLVKKSKGATARLLGILHDKLTSKSKLSGDTFYFNIVRILEPFQRSTDTQIYNDLTRDRNN